MLTAKTSLLICAFASLCSGAAIQPRAAQPSPVSLCRPSNLLNAYIILEQAEEQIYAPNSQAWIPQYNSDNETWSAMGLDVINTIPETSSTNRFNMKQTLLSRGTYQLESAHSTGLCPLSSGGPMQSFACDPVQDATLWFIRCTSCSDAKNTGCQIQSTYQASCATTDVVDEHTVSPYYCQDRSLPESNQLFTIANYPV